MLTYTYKLKPKAKRDGYLGDLIDRHNMLWNKFVWLEEVSRKRRGKHIAGQTLDRYVNLHKKGHGWDYMIAGMDAQSIQASIQRREVAFDKFFKYVKAKKSGDKPTKKESPPKYKRVKGFGSFTLKQCGWRMNDSDVTIGNFVKKDTHTYKYRDSRPMEGKIKTITIKRDNLGDFWLYAVTDATPFSPLPATGINSGFDFDADHFFVDSHGRHWDAPRFYFKYLADIKKLDRRIARCKKGSNNQKRLYNEKARLLRDIKNYRDDWQWKMAWEMCRTYDVLCFENLDFADMGKKNKAKEKSLSANEKRILKKWRRKMKDYSPAAFIAKVKWVAKKTGKKVLIDPSKWDPTSQKCHECGFVNKAVKNLSVKKWTCPQCKTEHDRDINAAINVEASCMKAEAANAKPQNTEESKGTRGCAGGASSVDVGQSGNPARESRWARIRKSSKPKGGDAGLAEGDLHGTQTHEDGLSGGIHQASSVGGCQGTPWCLKNRPGRFEGTEESLKEYFSNIPKNVDVLISHSPPYIPGEKIDDRGDGLHEGSKELTEAILDKKPRLVVCGHVHSGSRKPAELGDSKVMNVSRVDHDRSEEAHRPHIIHFHAKKGTD